MVKEPELEEKAQSEKQTFVYSNKKAAMERKKRKDEFTVLSEIINLRNALR